MPLVRLEATGLDLAGYALVVGDQDSVGDVAFPSGFSANLVERASTRPGSDWWAGDLREVAGRFRFRVFHREVFRAEVSLAGPGSDLVMPALAALAVGTRLGIDPAVIGDRLAECPPIPRRFETRGSYRGATLVDDDALGAGGVAAALGLARSVFGRRTIRAVYLVEDAGSETSQVGLRSPDLGAFGAADHLIVLTGESSCSESARLFAAGLRSSGASVVLCASLSGAIRELDRTLGPGDVVLTLGADAVGMIADALLRRLARDRHGR